MRYHHLGVAVRSLEKAIAVHQDIFGYDVLSGPFSDALQRVCVCFIGTGAPDEIPLELVAPLGDNSPIHSVLNRGVAAYHICYEVASIEHTLADVRSKGCLVVGEAKPAVAFSGRRIAWFLTPIQQLIEVLEQE